MYENEDETARIMEIFAKGDYYYYRYRKPRFKILKIIGKGDFGYIYEIKYKDKIFAAKLIKKQNEDTLVESDYITEFRGPGITKIIQVLKNKNVKNYNLIIMEKAYLKSLDNLNCAIYNDNLLDFIFKTPFELVGENLLRFFTKQLICGLEVLNRSNYCHFDIKPPNILIFLKLVIKLSDFGLAINPQKIKNKKNEFKIPGGTPGYLSPEFYQNNQIINVKDAIKQDFFALGSTLFYLKFGANMLYPNADFNEAETISNHIIELLERSIDKVKSSKLASQEFIDFLCKLIQYKPEERPDFEEVYRNKWLNTNSKELITISEINNLDEKKLIIELDKSDFLLETKEYIYKNRPKNIEKKLCKHKFVFNYGKKKY